ncbi:CBS domain-containing protein cbscbspb3 [Orobanche hederae]
MSAPTGMPAPRRNSTAQKRNLAAVKKSSVHPENGSATNGTNPNPSSPPHSSVGGERTVKNLRLSKALTIPEGTTVSDACRRMAARRVDAVLLTDANALLSGIVTDKDIATRVIAEELRPDQTTISKVMTRNPIFVNSDSLAIEALHKMVQVTRTLIMLTSPEVCPDADCNFLLLEITRMKFRHLPVVENGEVIALLDITKCLYDAISKMQKAAEQGSAIAAAVEGVELQLRSNFSVVATVSPSDPVYVAAKRMRELRVNSVLIMTGSNIQGILTSKDILMRVVARNLSPELTLVEKAMTPGPECATLETTILEALHIMHVRKFLHLPVVDKDGCLAACLDVLQITHAAISMVESSSGTDNDVANTAMQGFWDSALNLEPPDDYDTRSEMSMSQYVPSGSDATEHAKSAYPSLGLGNSFSFKFKDHKGRVHRFSFGTENLTELVSAVMQRVSAHDDQQLPQLLYEDDEGDKVLLTTDGDLVGAVTLARSLGLKVLRLHLDYHASSEETEKLLSEKTESSEKNGGHVSVRYYGIFAGAVVLTSIGVLVKYLKRSRILMSEKE